ncbi:MAG: GDP-mannose 4,6-dehydratase [Spirochaetia bacterium]
MAGEFWKNRNVFVTGATGLLGSWLTRALVESGAVVCGLIRDLVPGSNLHWSGFNEKINIVRGEVEDYFLLERALNEYEIDTVFHLAAQTIVPIANRNPLSTFETNIRGTWNLLEACRRAPLVKRVVVASSDKAYGDQESLPYNESFPLRGRHPYDVSKSCADLLCGMYVRTYSLPVCVTRCGNFYGGGDLNFNRIIPGTIRSLINNQAPVIRSDGTLIRDYIYIEDVVAAYLLLAQEMEREEIRGQAFNFSNETRVTVLELVNTIIGMIGSKARAVIRNNASNEIKHQYLDAAKARKLLGWNPHYTLTQGLEKTIAWYKEYFQS